MNVQVKLISIIMQSCAPGLVLTQRQKATRKWPVKSPYEVVFVISAPITER